LQRPLGTRPVLETGEPAGRGPLASGAYRAGPDRRSVEREPDPRGPQRLGQPGAGRLGDLSLRWGDGGMGRSRIPGTHAVTRFAGESRCGRPASRGNTGPRVPATGRGRPSARAGRRFVRVFEAVLAEGREFDGEVDHVCCSGWYLSHLHEHRFVMYAARRTRTCVCRVCCRDARKPSQGAKIQS
jgi:hypothetical protein